MDGEPLIYSIYVTRFLYVSCYLQFRNVIKGLSKCLMVPTAQHHFNRFPIAFYIIRFYNLYYQPLVSSDCLRENSNISHPLFHLSQLSNHRKLKVTLSVNVSHVKRWVEYELGFVGPFLGSYYESMNGSSFKLGL